MGAKRTADKIPSNLYTGENEGTFPDIASQVKLASHRTDRKGSIANVALQGCLRTIEVPLTRVVRSQRGKGVG